jgi:formylglycine-generating enzyme required for sulfatase activity
LSEINDGILRIRGFDVEFVHIEAGDFKMGSTHGLPLELPPHRVEIPQAFLFAKHLVRQDLWQSIMDGNPSKFQGDANLPVDSVSWDDANKFCQRTSDITGKQVRLPSEAEWEYACRAGTDTEFFFGKDSAMVGEYAWYDLNSRERTHPVGLKKPNPWGLFDVVGNLWEWCTDVWHGDYIGAPSDGSAWIDDADRQPRRSLRGAAWDMDAFRCRSAYRSYDWSHLGLSRFGLRVVIDI